MKDRKDTIQGEKICPVCDKDLSGMRITDVGNHIKWCKFQSNPDNTYSQAMKKANVTRFGAFASYKVTCNKCGTAFEVRQREHSFPKKEKYFCSRSCANSRSNLSQSWTQQKKEKIWTQQKKEKARVHSKKLWQNEQYAKRCLSNKFFTSKGQRLIRDYIISNHPDDEWTWGILNAKYKDTFFHPDMFSHKLKIVFQYDGEGHFKDIYKDRDFQKGKLKQALLQQWCMQNGYKLLRISESWFHSIGKDVSIVQNILYSLENPVTKLGAEYQE